eukprot:TRINITY_DN11171_c0_g1_i1.p1 TRINITY_DN11171_c0_g1~~TRINITY_DN11171_c0_g1_i1.p1  ORF type:complete len:467 (+),score=100.32 TRINITY_DN11171_c0_g1_i1:50-1450(+)
MLSRISSRRLIKQNRRNIQAPRFASSHSINYSDPSGLKQALKDVIPAKVQEVVQVRKDHGNKVLGEVTVDQAYMGMRGIKGLVTETSLLDENEGIRFRGYSIPECQEKLPKAEGGNEPLPESLLWLLLTGEVPTTEQVRALSSELSARAGLPEHVINLLDNFPKDLHPMSQFSSALTALNTDSLFAEAYTNGVNKKELWDHAYEDSLNLIANLPLITARIYRNVYKNGEHIPFNPALDYGQNYANMLGFDNEQFEDLMRLYLVIHSDHEGGNVSAHATHLVASALSDPYISYAAGLNGLAGPLHGLANQEVLRWLKQAQAALEAPITKEKFEQYCKDTLNSGKVIPGFGHAVLRKTDPRYTCQREFAQKHLPNDDLFHLVSLSYDVIPQVLLDAGKAKNPWPNVDAHSGCLLVHYGLVEENFYTVLFGVSRALGCMPSLVWDRILGLPLERPKSLTTGWIKNKFEQ